MCFSPTSAVFGAIREGMEMSKRDLYPVLDCREPEENLPTTLYHIQPIGIGTPHVESLWSFMHRIADATAVRLVDFFRYFLWARLGLSGSSAAAFILRAANRELYGLRIAVKIEEYTGQKGLAYVTLGPLNRFKAIQLYAKKDRAWCSACLGCDPIPYERLEWTLEGVTDCSVHRRPLERCCPQCGEPQRFTFSKTSLTRCSRCDGKRTASKKPSCNRVDSMAVWKSSQIGGVIASACLSSDGAIWRENLATSIRVHGGVKPFARAMGVKAQSVRGWRDGCRMLLRYACAWAWIVELDLRVLLTRVVPESEICLRSLPRSLKKSAPHTPRRAPVAVTHVLDVVQQIIQGNPHRTPRKEDVMARAGIHPKHPVFRHDLYRDAISAARRRERMGRCRSRVWRATADVNKAARKVLRSGLTFTQRNVMTFMDDKGAFAGPLARRYYHWLAHRIARGGLVPTERKPDAAVEYWNSTRTVHSKSRDGVMRQSSVLAKVKPTKKR